MAIRSHVPNETVTFIFNENLADNLVGFSLALLYGADVDSFNGDILPVL